MQELREGFSLEGNDLLVFENLDDSADVEAGTSDHEAAYTSGVDRLLALLLELERDLVPNVLLDRLGRHCCALFLKNGQLDLGGITEEAHDEVCSNEYDTLALLLELLSELGKVSNVKRRAFLLRLDHEVMVGSIAQN